jgi:hypothetical protein
MAQTNYYQSYIDQFTDHFRCTNGKGNIREGKPKKSFSELYFDIEHTPTCIDRRLDITVNIKEYLNTRKDKLKNHAHESSWDRKRIFQMKIISHARFSGKL